MNTKTVVRLAILLAIGAVVYYFVTGSVQKDMDKHQQEVNKAIENMKKEVPNHLITNP